MIYKLYYYEKTHHYFFNRNIMFVHCASLFFFFLSLPDCVVLCHCRESIRPRSEAAALFERHDNIIFFTIFFITIIIVVIAYHKKYTKTRISTGVYNIHGILFAFPLICSASRAENETFRNVSFITRQRRFSSPVYP